MQAPFNFPDATSGKKKNTNQNLNTTSDVIINGVILTYFSLSISISDW